MPGGSGALEVSVCDLRGRRVGRQAIEREDGEADPPERRAEDGDAGRQRFGEPRDEAVLDAAIVDLGTGDHHRKHRNVEPLRQPLNAGLECHLDPEDGPLREHNNALAHAESLPNVGVERTKVASAGSLEHGDLPGSRQVAPDVG